MTSAAGAATGTSAARSSGARRSRGRIARLRRASLEAIQDPHPTRRAVAPSSFILVPSPKEDGMLGGYISDLAAGDVFEPVEYVLTAYMCSEYAHGVEENCEWFHGPQAPAGRQIRPPTMIHV